MVGHEEYHVVVLLLCQAQDAGFPKEYRCGASRAYVCRLGAARNVHVLTKDQDILLCAAAVGAPVSDIPPSPENLKCKVEGKGILGTFWYF